MNNNNQIEWGRANNWAGTGPGNNSTGSFNFISSNNKLNNNNNLTGITMTGLVFTNTAGAYVIDGSAITLDGGITNLSASLQTINLAMVNNTSQKTINADAGNITLGGVMSGTGGIIKEGASVLTLSAANTYTGGTTINAGTLSLGAANVLANAGAVTVAGGTFNLGGFAETVGAVTLASGTITNGTLTGSSYAVQSGTVAAVLAGGGSLTKTGAGEVALSGANTYTGTTSINGGILSLGNASALGGNGSITFGGGTLRYSAVNTADLSSRITGSGSAISIDTAGQNITFASALAGSNTGGLTKSGSGTWTLLGSNTYSGETSISAGTLQVGNGGTAGTLGSGNVTNNAILVFNRSDNTSFGNIISGTGSVVKQGAGTLTLSGENSFSGGLSVFGGAVSAAQEGFLGAMSNAITLDNGKLLTTATVDLGPDRSVTFGAGGGTIEVATGTTATVDGLLAGTGNFTKTGTGTLALDAASSAFEGATLINQGTLRLNNENVLASSDVTVASGAALAVAFGNANIGNLGGAGNVTVSSNAIVGGLGTSATLGGTISGDGSLTKTGDGTLTLTGNNTHAGGVFLEGNGAVRAQSAGAFGSGLVHQASGSSKIIIDTTGTITNQMDIYNVSVLQSVTLTGAKVLNNATYDVTNNTTTVEAGNLSGTGGVTKLGTGTLLLSGDNSYTGAVDVQAGVLELASTVGGAAASTASVSVSSGATLLISQSNQVNNTATVSLSGGTITRGSGVSEVFGNLTVSSASFLDFGTGTTGTLSFGTYETPSALLTVNNFAPGNTLTFSSNLTSSISNGTLFSFDGQFTSGWDSGSSTFTITAIPEPSAYLAAAGLLALLLWPSRRRLFKDAQSILGLRARLATRH
ncbi:MAG: autotransporter-associated beta strand repeat-containing protein [Chthoniobacterales bacterium]